jgi:predicted DNA binding protein
MTCADVVDRLGIARATVGEHLQRIEVRVLSPMA